MIELRISDRFVRFSRILFLLPAIFIVMPTAAFGASWYVAALTGSDANACNAPNVPCRTINAAVSLAQPGEDVFVTAGIYTNSGPEVVRIGKSLQIIGGWDATFTNHLQYTILNGEHQRRGLVIEQGADVFMSDVAIIWGVAADGGGAYIEGGLHGDRMYIVQNRALRGGGIFFNGTVGDTLTLVDSAFFLNEYFFQGGGLFIDGYRLIDPSMGTSNWALLANVTVSNSISINSVDEEHGTPPTEGGGVYVRGGNFNSLHNTFAENTVFDGHVFTQNNAGIAADNFAVLDFRNTLVADGCSVLLVSLVTISEGNNVERGNTCNFTHPQDRINVNPQIFPPSRNPGPNDTITHSIAANSPAIDWGRSDWCINRDQRGISRPQGISCDVGAFERTASDPPMGLIIHPGRGFADSEHCPTLRWDGRGRVVPNPCRLDNDVLIRAIFEPAIPSRPPTAP